MDGTTFAAVGFTLLMAHSFGDHWVQTGAQAANKGRKDATGRAHCRRHVYGLTATKVGALFLMELVTGVRINVLALVIALTVDAVSHYWCDRRFTLEALCGKLERFGKLDFYHMGKDTVHQFNPSGSHLGTGAYALDQSFHHLFLFIAALIMSL